METNQHEQTSYDVHAVQQKWRQVWDGLDAFRDLTDVGREPRNILRLHHVTHVRSVEIRVRQDWILAGRLLQERDVIEGVVIDGEVVVHVAVRRALDQLQKLGAFATVVARLFLCSNAPVVGQHCQGGLHAVADEERLESTDFVLALNFQAVPVLPAVV